MTDEFSGTATRREPDEALRGARRRRALGAGAALVGFLIAWTGTSPRLGMGINWDNGVYITMYASGGFTWGHPPWNSHYAMGPVYYLVSAVARLFGGSYVHGFRLANALCLAGGAALFAVSAARLCRRTAIAALGTGLFLTAWGLLVLVFTLEDNILFLPAGLGVLALCLARLGRFRARDAAWAGAIAGAGALMSWQAVIYLFPPLWVALAQGGPFRARGALVRIRDAALTVAAFVATLVAWVVVYWATSRGTGGPPLSTLFQILLSRPEPSFFPRGLSGWLSALGKPVELLRHLGVGVTHELGPPFRDSAAVQALAPVVGGVTLALVLAVLVAAVVAAWRRDGTPVPAGDRLVFLAVVLVVFTVGTSFYLDLMIDKYKRYEYLPQLVALVAIGAVGRVADGGRRLARAAGGAIGLLVLVQAGAAVAWNAAWHRDLPKQKPPGYLGPGTTSWYGHLRGIRDRNPAACAFVFAFDELAHARWQTEITAVLQAELRPFVVVGDPAATRGWPRPLPVTAPAEVRLRGCEWISPAARARLPGPR